MRRNLTRILPIIPVLMVLACQNIPYKPDTEFRSPAQSEFYGFPIKIEEKLCKDIDGQVGACVKQIQSGRSVVIHHEARPYSYRLKVTCSFPIGVDFPVDVRKNEAYDVTIPPEKIGDWLMFTCRGEVFPNDRDQMVSSQWHVRVLVYDEAYKRREIIRRTKDRRHLVLGAHAKYGTVCDGEGCRLTKEKTVVPVSGRVSRAYSESEIQRFNWYEEQDGQD